MPRGVDFSYDGRALIQNETNINFKRKGLDIVIRDQPEALGRIRSRILIQRSAAETNVCFVAASRSQLKTGPPAQTRNSCKSATGRSNRLKPVCSQ